MITINAIKSTLKEHTPEILIGFGTTGMVGTVIMAVKATPKALMLIEERKLDMDTEKLPVIETVKATWKCYIPSVILGVSSIGCLIGSSATNRKRNAVITAAYSLTESILKEYREKVVETIGEEKEQTVRDAVAKERIEKDPVGCKEIIITNKGDTFCYDVISGRYFESSVDTIKKAVADLNRNMLDEMCISLNEFYYAIGLSDIPLGETLGWNIVDGYIEVRFSSQITENDKLCLVIDYLVPPKYDFYKNY